jgi:uncharacterized membrane protein HdeD (DUF308 family)
MLAPRWWMVAVRGVAAIVFGVLTFLAPAASLLALVVLFGAYALVDGAFNIASAIRSAKGRQRWGSLVFAGVSGIAAGVLTFVWPSITALILLFLIAAWAVVTGVAEVVAAIRLRKTIKGEWFLALSGVLSVVFGLLLFIFPGAGALAVTMWIGAYAIVFGGLLVGLAFRLRSWERTEHREFPTDPLHAPA